MSENYPGRRNPNAVGAEEDARRPVYTDPISVVLNLGGRLQIAYHDARDGRRVDFKDYNTHPVNGVCRPATLREILRITNAAKEDASTAKADVDRDVIARLDAFASTRLSVAPLSERRDADAEIVKYKGKRA